MRWFTDSEQILIKGDKIFYIFNILAPESPIEIVFDDSDDEKVKQPLTVLDNRFIIMKEGLNKLIFYDIKRLKIICKSLINIWGAINFVGDEIIFAHPRKNECHKLNLPYSSNAIDGDFWHYKAIDSDLPNPFTSVNEFIPVSSLVALTEFVSYPSYYSTL